MAKRKNLKLDYSDFNELLTQLDGLEGDLKKPITEAFEMIAEELEDDTKDAIADSNMPAGGKYSSGRTKEAVVKGARVEWSGTVGSIGVGFDFGKKSAAAYLISGTPRMKPNYELRKLYRGKKYRRYLEESMNDVVRDYVNDKLNKRR